MPNMKAKEVEANSQMFYASFFRRNFKSPLCQPSCDYFYALECIFFSFTKYAKIVGVPNDYALADGLSSVIIFDS